MNDSCASKPKTTEFGIWSCAECKKEARATVHQMRKTYCSKECMAIGYTKRLKGESNPNFKDASLRICERCNKEYKSYNKTRKYCSLKCSGEDKTLLHPKPCIHCGSVFKPNIPANKYCSQVCSRSAKTKSAKEKSEKLRPKKQTIEAIICHNCGDNFSAYKSSARKFCSYDCFIKSGGAQRAGDAAAMAKRVYGNKKDANHHQVFGVLQKLVPVKDLSDAGCGIPDGIAWVNNGWHLFDVKNPNTGYGRRGLNPRQKQWADNWSGGAVYLLYNEDDAIAFATGNFDRVKKYPDNSL